MSKNTAAYIAIICLLCVTSFFSIRLFFTEKTAHDKANIAVFPLTLGDWEGRDLDITEREYKILETRNLISREYVNSRNKKLWLFIIYSETNRLVFHPPEVCMIGSGLTIVDKQPETIYRAQGPFTANKLNVRADGRKEIVLYAYRAGNFYTDNFYFQQAYLAFHQIFGKLVPGATIRVSMLTGNDESQDLDTLKDFLSKTADIVDRISR